MLVLSKVIGATQSSGTPGLTSTIVENGHFPLKRVCFYLVRTFVFAS